MNRRNLDSQTACLCCLTILRDWQAKIDISATSVRSLPARCMQGLRPFHLKTRCKMPLAKMSPRTRPFGSIAVSDWGRKAVRQVTATSIGFYHGMNLQRSTEHYSDDSCSMDIEYESSNYYSLS